MRKTQRDRSRACATLKAVITIGDHHGVSPGDIAIEGEGRSEGTDEEISDEDDEIKYMPPSWLVSLVCSEAERLIALFSFRLARLVDDALHIASLVRAPFLLTRTDVHTHPGRCRSVLHGARPVQWRRATTTHNHHRRCLRLHMVRDHTRFGRPRCPFCACSMSLSSVHEGRGPPSYSGSPHGQHHERQCCLPLFELAVEPPANQPIPRYPCLTRLSELVYRQARPNATGKLTPGRR